MTKNLTIKQLAEALQTDYLAASALVKFFVEQGIAKKVGNLVVEGQRGKPSAIYEIPNVVELVFWDEDEANKELAEITEGAPEITGEAVAAPQTENLPEFAGEVVA
jgi:hypothetical protein